MTDTTAVPSSTPDDDGASRRPRHRATGAGSRARRARPTNGATVPLTDRERSLLAKLAAHTSWARTADPKTRTAPARAAFLARFERQVDPDGTMDPAERTRRADHARKAHMQALALRSARARRRNGKDGSHG